MNAARFHALQSQLNTIRYLLNDRGRQGGWIISSKCKNGHDTGNTGLYSHTLSCTCTCKCQIPDHAELVKKESALILCLKSKALYIDCLFCWSCFCPVATTCIKYNDILLHCTVPVKRSVGTVHVHLCLYTCACTSFTLLYWSQSCSTNKWTFVQVKEH